MEIKENFSEKPELNPPVISSHQLKLYHIEIFLALRSSISD